jgi:ATP-dependent DNA helicase RecG
MVFKESETIELKQITVDEIKKEIIAFANTSPPSIPLYAK